MGSADSQSTYTDAMSLTGNRPVLLLLAISYLVCGRLANGAAIGHEVGTTSVEGQDIGVSNPGASRQFSTGMLERDHKTRFETWLSVNG